MSTVALKSGSKAESRNGIAMYLVVIVVAILSLGAIALFSIITTERQATTIRGDEIQVRAAAESGIEFVRSICNLTEAEQTQLGGIVNNPKLFAGVEVLTTVRRSRPTSFRFTVLAPNINGGKLNGVRYGLTNESARLHLETVLQWEQESPGRGRQALMSLPGMHPGIADSILDWIDPDATQRSSGAEIEYYRRIGVPYGPRNAIPVSLEELLLVRDVSRSLLFGDDANFSFGFSPHSATRSEVAVPQGSSSTGSTIIAPEIPSVDSPLDSGLDGMTPPEFLPEQIDEGFSMTDTVIPPLDMVNPPPSVDSPLASAMSSFGQTASQGNMPWAYYLTTLSAEKEVNPQGIAKFDLNEANLEYLYTQIKQAVDEQAADFVVLARKDGKTLETPLDLLTPLATTAADGTPETVASPFDAKVSGGSDRLSKLLDYGTTSRAVVITGRININEAPLEVLRAIPEMTENTASQIIARRQAIAASSRRTALRHPTWLLTEELVDLPQMKSLWNRITTGGSVYRCQVVGFLDDQGTASRFEVVVDATVKPPRQVFFKDLTMYGRGFSATILRP